jgi:hypothetical protein
MNWEAFHHRGEILHTVITEVDARRDGVLPTDVPGADHAFRDELDMLAALMLRWTTRLYGRIERELADQPLDLEAAVVAAWRATAGELPGIRAVIDRHRAEPLDEPMAVALAKSARKEHSMLAVMAGRVSTLDPDDLAARIGADIEDRARAGLEPAARRAQPVAVPNLLERLKAALAA